MYVGNYEFWYESSQLMQRMIRDQNKKKEEKIRELQEFVSRFSANKSKSKQATARRKLLEKLSVEEMPASSRRYPFVGFRMDREPGKEILAVEGLTKTVDGRKVLDNVSFRVNKGDKIAFVGEDEIATTTLFKILMEELEPDAGTFKWGTTITTSYFPLDNSAFFNDCDLNLVDWLGQYTADNAEEGTESFKRSFLGRMLFSGDDVYKPVKVLSGGEKVRCMLSRMMLFGSNVLVLDQPTNHLDLESITAVNNGLIDFKGRRPVRQPRPRVRPDRGGPDHGVRGREAHRQDVYLRRVYLRRPGGHALPAERLKLPPQRGCLYGAPPPYCYMNSTGAALLWTGGGPWASWPGRSSRRRSPCVPGGRRPPADPPPDGAASVTS